MQLTKVVLKAMSPRREDRYPTALALRRALESEAAAPCCRGPILRRRSVRSSPPARSSRRGAGRAVLRWQQVDLLQVPELQSRSRPPPCDLAGPWRSSSSKASAKPAPTIQPARAHVHQPKAPTFSRGGQMVGGNTSIRVDLSQRTQVAQGPDDQSLLRRPLFLGLLVVGILTVIVAAVVQLQPVRQRAVVGHIDSDRAARRFASTASRGASLPQAHRQSSPSRSTSDRQDG